MKTDQAGIEMLSPGPFRAGQTGNFRLRIHVAAEIPTGGGFLVLPPCSR